MERDFVMLCQAVRQADLAKVKEILNSQPTYIEQKDKNGIPLVLQAAKTGSLDLVRYLVEYTRASMNETDDQHKNILHYAAQSGNTKLCRYLVERVGMDPCSGDVNLLTPFEIAREQQDQELEDYFETVAEASWDQLYQNPIRTGMFPDPSIVRVGEDYYMVNSSFIFFPCIPVSHSTDLIHWQVIGHAITNSQWSNLADLEGGRGYWAPDISYDEGIFYVTATYRLNDDETVLRRQMVVTSKNPEGPYSKPVFLDEDGIDPSIFHENGKHYMLLNRGARIFEISKDGTKILSAPKLLYYGDQKRAPEGPHLLKKDGYYYLFLAEGGTGAEHRISVARSKTLDGVYQSCPYNPIMIQSDRKAGIQRCGHGKPVCTQHGEWYMVYLCGRMVQQRYSVLGRETAIDPIIWTLDGWPLINCGNGPSVLQKKPNLPAQKPAIQKLEQLSLVPLAKEWFFPREPESDAIRYEQGNLLLKSSTYPLADIRSRNILLCRQKDFTFVVSASICLTAMKTGQESGLIGYYDENTWLSFKIMFTAEGYQLQIHEHVDEEDIFHEPVSIREQEGENITLTMKTEYLMRTFCYQGSDGNKRKIAHLSDVYYLSDEGIKKGKRFTGALLGLYGYSKNEGFYSVIRSFRYDPITRSKRKENGEKK